MAVTHSPLQRELQKTRKRSSGATPAEAFSRARRIWLKGDRLHLADLAEELGIGRATLFRWVGNKDLLLGDILWSLYEPIRASVVASTPGNGVDFVVEVYRRITIELVSARPLRDFIKQDPEHALRVLTSSASTMHSRVVEANTLMIQDQVDKGCLEKPPMRVESLSYFMVRLAESCLYSDVIIGREPNIQEVEEACLAVKILLGGKP
ncbi:QsdR family transcriptional regulator [Marinobacter bryozoorum]|uniref:QsdR family transcriptional regulator n=1 Tax=Marinobacter bryozoorum TaxID=256324 RepID=UPI0020034DB0|nr:QsdR family transcriptional regulator [Marinobacter bryozoorum]